MMAKGNRHEGRGGDRRGTDRWLVLGAGAVVAVVGLTVFALVLTVPWPSGDIVPVPRDANRAPPNAADEPVVLALEEVVKEQVALKDAEGERGFWLAVQDVSRPASVTVRGQEVFRGYVGHMTVARAPVGMLVAFTSAPLTAVEAEASTAAAVRGLTRAGATLRGEADAVVEALQSKVPRPGTPQWIDNAAEFHPTITWIRTYSSARPFRIKLGLTLDEV